jgi:hypothetical protein
MTNLWIDIEPGNRPEDDENVFVRNDVIKYTPILAYYDSEFDMFFPLHSIVCYPIVITHFMRIPK